MELALVCMVRSEWQHLDGPDFDGAADTASLLGAGQAGYVQQMGPWPRQWAQRESLDRLRLGFTKGYTLFIFYFLPISTLLPKAISFKPFEFDQFLP